MSEVNIRELDVFFLSYDEPNCEENWSRVLSLQPSAKRVHGVAGFDTAHKVCAMSSSTHRLVIIDGDNWLQDNWLTTLPLNDTGLEDACFSFSSVNHINGLKYGNGGIKVWNKDVLLNSSTHERAASGSTDFCWDIRYMQVDEHLSVTVQNASQYQAWRSGYREGIKMTQHEGVHRANLKDTWQNIYSRNLSRLHVWCSVGRDISNGIWSILGARQAVLDLMKNQVDQTSINDYTWFKNKWETITDIGPEVSAENIRIELREDFDFYIPELPPDQSNWFKMVYINPNRAGLMR